MIALVAIDAMNLWSQFARHLFISSALGARTVNGASARAQARIFRTPEEVLDFAITTLSPTAKPKKGKGWSHREEPPWSQAGVLLRLTQAARLTNETQIISALGVQGRFLEDLPRARNFFAHRSANTVRFASSIAGRYTLSQSLRPAVLLGSRSAGKPYTVLEGWLAEMHSMVTLLPR